MIAEQQVDEDDVANILILIGRRNPSEISNYIRLLRVQREGRL